MFGQHILKLRAALGDQRIGRLLHWLPGASGRGLIRGPVTTEWEAAALFDPDDYRTRYPDVGGRDPWAHYLAFGVREGRDPNPLFDTSYYLERYPDVAASGLNPLVHYIVAGAREGRDPHALMRSAEYLDRYPEVASSGVNPLAHYLVYGGREGCWPNPLFDSAWYAHTYPEVAGNPLADYVTSGAAAGRNPHPLFDTEFYLSQCPELRDSGRNPLDHYFGEGAYRFRPHPLFETSYYLEQYPDVQQRKVNPLVHYLNFGAQLGCRPHPLFDTAYYRSTYGERLAEDTNPLADYATEGATAGCFPNPLFDSAWYLETYPDVAAAGRNPLADYAECPAESRRRPNPLFDPDYYLQRYPEAAEQDADPLQHYLDGGAFSECNPCPLFDSSYYLAQNPEVADAGVNPLAHYLYQQRGQSSDPHPLFDTVFYLRRYLAGADEVPLVHYSTIGWREGNWPNPLFDPDFYLSNYPELARCNPLVDYLESGSGTGRNPNELFDSSFYRDQHLAGDSQGNPLAHYLHKGAYQGAKPSRGFDSSYYLENNPDVASAGLNPLAHYLWVGREQGRLPMAGPLVSEPPLKSAGVLDGPTISILMPVFNTPPRLLEAAVRSVKSQTYRNWELCLVDDGSTQVETCRAFATVTSTDNRIRSRTIWYNRGISGATNTALEMATGRIVALVDHDDELTPDALAAVAHEFLHHPDAQAVYTDHEVIEEDGARAWVFTKPDWSPELFRGVMYAGHLLALRRQAVVDCGGFDSKFDGVQDFEFLLRLSERTREIRHIRQVLYRWRKAEGSVASGQGNKPGIQQKHLAAVNAHLDRLGVPARAVLHEANPDLLRLEPSAKPDREDFEVLGDIPAEAMTPEVFRHLAMYAGMPGVACAAPVVLRVSGRVHDAGILTGATPRYAYSGWAPSLDGHGGSLACAREVSLVGGGCGVILKSRLRELGGIGDRYSSPRFRLLAPALRARSQGLRNIIVPACPLRMAGVESGPPADETKRFFADWALELEGPDPYSHPGFDHPSHLSVTAAPRFEHAEWTLGA